MEERLYGFYRSKVVDNKDPKKFGRVLVWIPDIMPEIEDTQGLWARPGNNPMGGRNTENDSEHHYSGTSYIPKIGSWTWVFFESGNPNLPYYWGAIDIENTPVLPENQLGTNYEDKWTIFKSHNGRCIVISDDPDDERVEITGKKRILINDKPEPPTGDLKSVTQIDGNQTVILLDEREGVEKILMRTYLGDFIHIDVDERKLQIEFDSDIHIESKNGNIYIEATVGDIHTTSGRDTKIHSKRHTYVKADDDIMIRSLDNMDVYSGDHIRFYAVDDIHAKAGDDIFMQAGDDIDIKAGGNITTDGSKRYDQCGQASSTQTASQADDAVEAEPVGERDT